MGIRNVQLLLFENSDTLDEEASSDDRFYLDSLLSAIQRKGLAPCPVFADAQISGCPQQRRRWYIIAAKAMGALHFNLGLRP
eukprot:5046688-Karenia_brevis.AAC.1